MGWGIKLKPWQWDELDRLRFSTSSADIFRNCLIILMSDSRDRIKAIAERVGCGYDTVVRLRRLYRKGGIQALYPAKPNGRPSRANRKFIDAMVETAKRNPISLGYGFSTWSTARLGKHLAKVTGVCFSPDHLRRLLRRHGFSVQRPKHTLKGKRDEILYRKAHARLAQLKKSP